MADPLLELQQAAGYQFQDETLLIEAMTHPSYAAETSEAGHDNQRLEFLGDAVIEIVFTDKIYHLYPNMPEGRMTKLRATITRQPALVELAKRLDLGGCLRLGRGEAQSGGGERASNLCDAFEALIGAIYLDSGNRIDDAARLLNELVDAQYPELEPLLRHDNPKGALQEWSQQNLQEKPVYDIVDVSGPDHQRRYTIAVSIGPKCYGQGIAGRRQTAEEEAARKAMQEIRRMPTASDASPPTPEDPACTN